MLALIEICLHKSHFLTGVVTALSLRLPHEGAVPCPVLVLSFNPSPVSIYVTGECPLLT